MKTSGMKLVGKAEENGNEVRVPMTRGLGLSDLLKKSARRSMEVLESGSEASKIVPLGLRIGSEAGAGGFFNSLGRF